MKKAFVLFVVVGILVMAGQQASALSEVLHAPRIFWPKGFDNTKAEQVTSVLRSDKLAFRGGLISYWQGHREVRSAAVVGRTGGRTADIHAFGVRVL